MNPSKTGGTTKLRFWVSVDGIRVPPRSAMNSSCHIPYGGTQKNRHPDSVMKNIGTTGNQDNFPSDYQKRPFFHSRRSD